MAAGNTELCEITDVEPKSQWRACLTHWTAGIVCCTCGHLKKDDTTENKKCISSVLDLFSIPKGPATLSKVRESTWMQRVPHGKSTSKEVSQEEIWQHPWPIHPRQVLQKNDDRVRSLWRDHPGDGSARKRRPQSYCHKRRNWRLPWQLVDSLERGEFRYDVDKASAWLQESIVDIVPPEASGGQEAPWNLSQSSSSWWQWQTNWWEPYYENSPQRWSRHWLNGETCVLGASTIHLWCESQQQLNAKIHRECIGDSWQQSTVTDGGCK